MEFHEIELCDFYKNNGGEHNGGWKKEKRSYIYLLLTNTRVDEVEAFLDFFANGWWRGNVIALRVKAGLIGSVVNGDQLSLGTRVRKGALLHDRFRPVFTFADGLDVATFLSDNIVACFVTVGFKSFMSNNRLRKTDGPENRSIRVT